MNDTSHADDAAILTSQDRAAEVTLNGHDADGDPLSFVVVSEPLHGLLSGSAPNLTYTPNPGFAGSDSFTFQVQDSASASNIATVSIDVAAAQAPESWSFQDGVLPTADYHGTEDVSVRGDDPTANFGTRTSLWLDGSPDQAAFLRWDLTAIPPGSTVHAASITVHVVTTSLNDFNLYEMLVPWVEQEATYSQRRAGVPWEVAGAQGASERSSTVLGVISGPHMGEMVITLNSAGLAAVQRWIDDPGSNHGVVFQDFDNANTDDLDFASSDAKVAETRPKLSLSVSPTTAISALSFSSSALRNSINPFDVDSNGTVSPIDVLVVINVVNRRAEGESFQKSAEAYADVSGDGVVSSRDALLVINYLTRKAFGAAGEGSSSGIAGPSAIPLPNDDNELWSVDLEATLGDLAADQAYRGIR